MPRAKVVPIKKSKWDAGGVIASKADYADPLTPRQQSRYSGKLVASPPPFKPSRIRNLIGAIVSAVAA